MCNPPPPKKKLVHRVLHQTMSCLELALVSSLVIVNYKFINKNHFSDPFYLKQEIIQTLTFSHHTQTANSNQTIDNQCCNTLVNYQS